MKNLRYLYSLSLTATLLLFTACSDDDGNGGYHTNTGNQIEVRSLINALKYESSTENSRAQIDPNTGQITWTGDDKLSVWYNPSHGESYRNLEYTLKSITDPNLPGEFSTQATARWSENSSSNTFYALFPYSAAAGENLTSARTTLGVEQPQTGSPNDYNNYGILYGKRTYDSASDFALIQMEIPVAVIDLNLDATATTLVNTLISSFTIEADKPIAGDALINLETGVISQIGSNMLKVSFADPLSLASVVESRIAIFPQDGDVNVTISFSSTFYDTYVTPTLSGPFEAGYIYSVDVDVDQLLRAGEGQSTYKGSTDLVIRDLDKESNSFLVTPGEIVTIPVEKAYDIWADEFESILFGNMNARLLWQDEPSLITDVIIQDEDQGRNAKILVGTTEGITGNALISFEIDDEVKWSWHLWVTDYDPAQGGETFTNPTTGITLMDRNLGASTIVKGSAKSMGLNYQWGRKDPGPRARTMPLDYYDDIWDSAPLYTISNEEHLEAVDNVLTAIEAVPQFDHLRMSIEHPTVFFYSYDLFGDFLWGDWSNINYGVFNYKWWLNTDDGSKTKWDPCPQGWQVPVSNDWRNEPVSTSPWTGLILRDALDGCDLYTSEGSYMGYYPFSGQRSGNSEAMSFLAVGKDARLWTANPAQHNYSGVGEYDQEYVFWLPNNIYLSSYRDDMMNLRCMKSN